MTEGLRPVPISADALYATNDGIPHELARINLDAVSVVIKPFRITNSHEQSLTPSAAYRELVGVFFVSPNDSTKEVLYRVLPVPAQYVTDTNVYFADNEAAGARVLGRVLPEDAYELFMKTTDPRIRRRKDTTATGEEVTHKVFDFDPAPGVQLKEAILALAYDKKLFTSEERKILTLLLVNRAYQGIDLLKDQGIVHGHPHSGNFQVDTDMSVRLIDLKWMQRASEIKPITHDHDFFGGEGGKLWFFFMITLPIMMSKGYGAFDIKGPYTEASIYNQLMEALSGYDINSLDFESIQKRFQYALMQHSLSKIGITDPTIDTLETLTETEQIAIAQMPEIIR